MNTFLEINAEEVAGKILLVDIDGTLTYDHGLEIDEAVREKLKDLAKVAEIYLCSNGPIERTRALAVAEGVRCIDSLHRKPNKKLMEHVERGDKEVIVIGDKALTDGVFAKNICAHFLPVKHLRHKDDGFITRASYLVDDIASVFMCVVFPVWPYLALLRPFQWIKNILVFCPIFFAGTFLEPHVFMRTLFAALTFSTVASAAYVFNDLCDLEQDRLHPVKRFRPLASGAVSALVGKFMLGLLLVLLGFELWYIPSLLPIIASYVVLNTAYSTWLKHIPVIDIALVASFYVLRIVAGGVASGTHISPWIVLCAFFGALFIVIGKRRAEFTRAEKRKVLSKYSQASLDAMLFIATALILASYGLYSILGSKSPYAVYSTVFVVMVLFQMLNRMFLAQAVAEYPEQLLFKDRSVLGLLLLWLIFMSIILY